jgi:hypothetical protein
MTKPNVGRDSAGGQGGGLVDPRYGNVEDDDASPGQ